MNEEVNRKNVSKNMRKSYENNRRMITRTSSFNMKEQVALRKKNKICNEEPLVFKKILQHNSI